MGFFDHLQPKGSSALKTQKPQIRRQLPLANSRSPSQSKSTTPVRDAVSRTQAHGGSPAPVTQRASHSAKAGKPAESTPSRTKRRLQRKPQKPIQVLESSTDDSGSSDDEGRRKRFKLGGHDEITSRRLMSPAAFADHQDKTDRLIHGAHLVDQELTKYKLAFTGSSMQDEISLRYPSRKGIERYRIAEPKQSDEFKPLEDITLVVDMVIQHYFPEEQRELFGDEISGLVRRLRRAVRQDSKTMFRDAVLEYNKITASLVRDGSIQRLLASRGTIPLPLLERILTQIYERVVSPAARTLTKYENGTDNVYGELLHRFSSQIFRETSMKPGQIFVDLGSGVGNVVLQAALEVGCESWGCEIMTNATTLAVRQKDEFEARCKLWGLAPGTVHLQEGDFLTNEKIREVLPQADVVLVNNQAFTPDLNDKLVHLFLDLKDGCQIVSLKSFIPAGHKITERNRNAVVNMLTKHRELNYWSGSVSWTNAGGTYHIVTKQALSDP